MANSMRAADFIGSIGIDAHLGQLNSSANTAKTLAAFQYLGIDHVRAAASWTLMQGSTVFSKLAEAGVKFDMLLPSAKDPVETVSRVAEFARAHPGAVAAIEGPNEIDHWPVTYGGLTGVAGGVAFLNAAAGAAGTIPALAGVDIYDLTGAPRAALSGDAAEFANIHPYPQLGNQPYNVIATRMALHGVAGKGMVITEAGYHTGIGNQAWEGVDQTTQAKLTLNLLADATKLGVARTYLYQLLDYRDPSGINVDKNLGLFDSSFQPKQSATAIHNLTSILADDAATASSFATHALDYRLSGLPAESNSLLLEKAGGVHDLLLWAEPDIWDEAADKPIHVATTYATVDFGGRQVDVRIFDPLISDQPIASYTGVASVEVAVSDHPVIVEVSGAADGPVVLAPARVDPSLWLSGGKNADVITGGSGDDVLKGFAANDRLDGAAGADTLIGGIGADLLTGGSGADLFAFKTFGESKVVATGRDEILDFSRAEGDRIDLTGIDANSRIAGNQSFTLGGAQFTRKPGELVQTASGDGYLLQGDLNGDGRAEFAVLLSHVTQPLAADGFLL